MTLHSFHMLHWIVMSSLHLCRSQFSWRTPHVRSGVSDVSSGIRRSQSLLIDSSRFPLPSCSEDDFARAYVLSPTCVSWIASVQIAVAFYTRNLRNPLDAPIALYLPAFGILVRGNLYRDLTSRPSSETNLYQNNQ